jgi:hypothetical protein
LRTRAHSLGAAAALQVIFGQGGAVLGFSQPTREALYLAIYDVMERLPQTNWGGACHCTRARARALAPVALTRVRQCAVSIIVLLLVRRLHPSMPGALFVVLLATLTSWVRALAHACPVRALLTRVRCCWQGLDLRDTVGLSVIGVVPSGLPTPSAVFVDLSLWTALLPNSIVVALLGFLEAITIGTQMATQTTPGVHMHVPTSHTSVSALPAPRQRHTPRRRVPALLWPRSRSAAARARLQPQAGAGQAVVQRVRRRRREGRPLRVRRLELRRAEQRARRQPGADRARPVEPDRGVLPRHPVDGRVLALGRQRHRGRALHVLVGFLGAGGRRRAAVAHDAARAPAEGGPRSDHHPVRDSAHRRRVHAGACACACVRCTCCVCSPPPQRLWHESKRDLLVLIAAFLGTTFLGVLNGLLVGLGASFLMLTVRLARPHYAILGRVPNTSEFVNIKRYPGTHTYAGVPVLRFESAIFFGNIMYFLEVIRSLEKHEKYGRVGGRRAACGVRTCLTEPPLRFAPQAQRTRAEGARARLHGGVRHRLVGHRHAPQAPAALLHARPPCVLRARERPRARRAVARRPAAPHRRRAAVHVGACVCVCVARVLANRLRVQLSDAVLTAVRWAGDPKVVIRGRGDVARAQYAAVAGAQPVTCARRARSFLYTRYCCCFEWAVCTRWRLCCFRAVSGDVRADRAAVKQALVAPYGDPQLGDMPPDTLRPVRHPSVLMLRRGGAPPVLVGPPSGSMPAFGSSGTLPAPPFSPADLTARGPASRAAMPAQPLAQPSPPPSQASQAQQQHV